MKSYPFDKLKAECAAISRKVWVKEEIKGARSIAIMGINKHCDLGFSTTEEAAEFAVKLETIAALCGMYNAD